jgi:hypothetical protein
MIQIPKWIDEGFDSIATIILIIAVVLGIIIASFYVDYNYNKMIVKDAITLMGQNKEFRDIIRAAFMTYEYPQV